MKSAKQIRKDTYRMSCGPRPEHFVLPLDFWEKSPNSGHAGHGPGPNGTMGCDIGGVIARYTRKKKLSDGGGATALEDTQLSDGSRPPITDECCDAITQLVCHFGADYFFLVSKAGPTMQAMTLRWLTEQDFFNRTGVRNSHIFFCQFRPQKRAIVGTLNITHFIDDRWSVLVHLDICTKRYLFPCKGDDGVPTNLIATGVVMKVTRWADVTDNL